MDVMLETGGTVWKLLVAEGDAVTDGQDLFIMEVMKMEVPYTAEKDGVVAGLNISEGDVLETGHRAMTIR